MVALSAKEQMVLGEVAAVCNGGGDGDGKQRLGWGRGLHALHFRLAQLLHRAGARPQPPDWAEYAAHAARQAAAGSRHH